MAFDRNKISDVTEKGNKAKDPISSLFSPAAMDFFKENNQNKETFDGKEVNDFEQVKKTMEMIINKTQVIGKENGKEKVFKKEITKQNFSVEEFALKESKENFDCLMEWLMGESEKEKIYKNNGIDQLISNQSVKIKNRERENNGIDQLIKDQLISNQSPKIKNGKNGIDQLIKDQLISNQSPKIKYKISENRNTENKNREKIFSTLGQYRSPFMQTFNAIPQNCINKEESSMDIHPLETRSSKMKIRIKLFQRCQMEPSKRIQIDNLVLKDSEIRFRFSRTIYKVADILQIKRPSFRTLQKLKNLFVIFSKYSGLFNTPVNRLNTLKRMCVKSYYAYQTYVLPLEQSGMFMQPRKINEKRSMNKEERCMNKEERCMNKEERCIEKGIKNEFNGIEKGIKNNEKNCIKNNEKNCIKNNEKNCINNCIKNNNIRKEDFNYFMCYSGYDDMLFILEQLENSEVPSNLIGELLNIYFITSLCLLTKFDYSMPSLNRIVSRIGERTYKPLLDQMDRISAYKLQLQIAKVIFKYEHTKNNKQILSDEVLVCLIETLLKRKLLRKFRDVHSFEISIGKAHVIYEDELLAMRFVSLPVTRKIHSERILELLPVVASFDPGLVVSALVHLVITEKSLISIYEQMESYIRKTIEKHMKTVKEKFLLNDKKELEWLILLFLPMIRPSMGILTEMISCIGEYQENLKVKRVYFIKKGSSNLEGIKKYLENIKIRGECK